MNDELAALALLLIVPSTVSVPAPVVTFPSVKFKSRMVSEKPLRSINPELLTLITPPAPCQTCSDAIHLTTSLPTPSPIVNVPITAPFFADLPSSRVPALTMVGPTYELAVAPTSMRAPAPVLVKPKLPLIEPLTVKSALTSQVCAAIREMLLAMLWPMPLLLAIPPSPIDSALPVIEKPTATEGN